MSKIIDIHTHVFSANFVPVAGILASVLGQKMTDSYLDLLHQIHGGDVTEEVVDDILSTAGDDMPAKIAALIPGGRRLAAAADRAARHLPRDERRRHDLTVNEGRRAAIASFFARAGAEIDARESDPRRRRGLGHTHGSGHGDERGSDHGHRSPGAQTLAWAALMLRPEKDIWDTLARTYPDVEFFVHHMMDMENHYAGRAAYPFAREQIPRMLRLAEGSGGRLRVFTAFDPFRHDCLAIIEQALRDGCLGVKFYPPNGYKPIGNTMRDRGFRPIWPLPRTVDKRNLALFRFCLRDDMPIFAHCALGDLQARPGTERFADPRFWEQVLRLDETAGGRTMNELRLCLAHAGGAQEWAVPPDKEEYFRASYAGKVVELCSTDEFPNLYCDVGMFDEIFDDEQRGWLVDRLTRVIQEHPIFASRVMYGSDWHMLYRREQHAGYLAAFQEVFSRGPLAEHAEDFFYNNARRYLKLDGS